VAVTEEIDMDPAATLEVALRTGNLVSSSAELRDPGQNARQKLQERPGQATRHLAQARATWQPCRSKISVRADA
jgi:hypothetical protein